ncbi:hypothetical protein EJB05_44520 [Eragrostis curvula]|uniref:CASP-like protein n=1 Tax=Eragrostis curvula TaxID=38414 RepID=A0A5J9THX4_9POAL|nr:hypothetical protein EJB05_44520 [Eragrostis curvula]
MNDVVGRPGTRISLVLRVSQLVCAAASWLAIPSWSYSAFIYLYCSMYLQFLWSLGLVCVDIICLVTNTAFNDPGFASVVLVGDWCIGILSFSAATASAGVVILFKRDTEFCRAFPPFACDQYELSAILAFMAWSFIAASALSLFWFRVSFLV